MVLLGIFGPSATQGARLLSSWGVAILYLRDHSNVIHLTDRKGKC